MAYMFELIGIFPTLSFFQQQQRLEQTPKRSKVDKQTLEAYRVDWHPSADLPKWAITIAST
ncbi:MAG: hypothetical protein F6J97_00380 [Leptolyngbya sp. SIO4C1]|nr:hypothetical protein [Leptolyngbya sp. SIO4C1]